MNTTLSRIDAALEALETWRSEPLLLRMDQLQTEYKQAEAERMKFLSAQQTAIGSTSTSTVRMDSSIRHT